MRRIWPGMGWSGYRSRVGRPVKSEPERQPDSLLAEWAGHWVALQGGEVIAAAYSPRELAAKLHEMGPNAAKAVARFVPNYSDDIVIGVG